MGGVRVAARLFLRRRRLRPYLHPSSQSRRSKRARASQEDARLMSSPPTRARTRARARARRLCGKESRRAAGGGVWGTGGRTCPQIQEQPHNLRPALLAGSVQRCRAIQPLTRRPRHARLAAPLVRPCATSLAAGTCRRCRILLSPRLTLPHQQHRPSSLRQQQGVTQDSPVKP
jgi:hypothetical protein